ncbi:MAG: AAA family ATPase [Dongiaceae bacterium]
MVPDSGKTTILDAIELALAARYQVGFNDTDFHATDPSKPISITVTLGDLPDAFRAMNKYGELLRGWDAVNQVVVDEPDDTAGLEYVLSVRLTVDHTLEPKWRIYTDRTVEGAKAERGLSFEDRQSTAPTRLGLYADRHLAWGKHSVLTRLAGKSKMAADILVEATRTARKHFTESGEALFKDIVDRVPRLAGPIGVRLSGTISARLDVESVSVTAGGISLHEGDLPLRLLGSGSSRLLVAALQDQAGETSPIALIDELEHGLEPHRISRFLRYLKTKHDGERPQWFLTTHSPVVLQELSIEDIVVIRRDSATGNVAVLPANSNLADLDAQGPLRSVPDAYLGRSVLVCEGKTEVGLVRGLDHYWSRNARKPLATLGVVPINGGGKDSAPKHVKHFHALQYGCALLLDSDRSPDDATILPALTALGVPVIRWEKGKASEDVLFRDLGDAAVKKIVDILASEDDLQGVPDQLRSQFSDSVQSWEELKARCTEPAIRTHLAECAKKSGWLKTRMSIAERIGREVLGPHVSELKGENETCIASLRAWIDGQ